MLRPLEMDSTFFEVLTSADQAARIAGEWNELHQTCGAPLFCGYDWFRLWWDTIGQKKWTPHIVTARQNGRLAGVLPLAVRRHCGLRLLEWAGNDIFDYCRPLMLDEAIANELWDHALKTGGYDLLSIKDVREESRCFPILHKFAHAWLGIEALHINLKGLTRQSWLESLSSKTRRNIPRKKRALEKNGPVTFSVSRTGSGNEAFAKSLAVQRVAWRTRKNVWGVFDPKSVENIIQGLVRLASRHGQLFMATLSCGEKPVAHILGLIENGTLHNHTMAFDEEWSECSPGILVLAESILWAIDNGFQKFDFMRGNESYKKSFANGSSRLFHFLHPRSIAGKLAYYGLITALYFFTLARIEPPEMFAPYSSLPKRRLNAAK